MVISTRRRSVISSMERLVASGLMASMRRSDSRARVRGVVRWAVIVSGSSSKATRCSRDGTDFSVAEILLALVALPEFNATSPSVAVRWAGTVALLFLVMAAEELLKWGGDEEKEGSDDCDGEANSVESANRSKRGRVGDLVAFAAKAVLGV